MRPLLVRPLLGTGAVTVNHSVPLPVAMVVDRKREEQAVPYERGWALFASGSCPCIVYTLSSCNALHHLPHLPPLSQVVIMLPYAFTNLYGVTDLKDEALTCVLTSLVFCYV